MKKIIGILGVFVIAMAMFFNTSAMNSSNGDLDLASLLNMNTANAECGPAPSCASVCGPNPLFYCILTCELNPPVYCWNSYPH